MKMFDDPYALAFIVVGIIALSGAGLSILLYKIVERPKKRR